jgi:hypothetical protein
VCRYGNEAKEENKILLVSGGISFAFRGLAYFYLIRKFRKDGFGGLVVCVLVPEFAVSNPAEAVGFFLCKKSSARLPSEGKLK